MLQHETSEMYKKMVVTLEFQKWTSFYPTSQGLLIYDCFQDQDKISTLH